jgi:hypothetical protein
MSALLRRVSLPLAVVALLTGSAVAGKAPRAKQATEKTKVAATGKRAPASSAKVAPGAKLVRSSKAAPASKTATTTKAAPASKSKAAKGNELKIQLPPPDAKIQ